MIRQIFTYGKKYAAIEHAEKNTFQYLQLTKKKDEFVISTKIQADNFNEITQELKGQKHVFLIFNDEQVLSKKVEISTTDPKVILRTAFPNIIISDFYYEVHSLETNSFVSIARKEFVDTWISKYAKAKISVIDFSLGNIAIKNLQNFVKNEDIYTSNAKVSFDEHVVSEIKKEPIINETYKINDLEVSSKELLSLGGIISYYSKTSTSAISEDLKQGYIQKRFFDIGLKTALGFLLILLLANAYFFTTYKTKVDTLAGELKLSESYKKQLGTLQNIVTQKKRLVASVHSASNSKLSQYIDELGITVPTTILLKQIQYQPLKGAIKIDKELVFEGNKIVVKGTSKQDEYFSNWISVLQKKEWIQTVSILEYGKGRKRSAISDFEFIIHIHE